MDFSKARKLLQKFAFSDLFIQELGWDNYQEPLEFEIDGLSISLTSVAEKRGMLVYHCPTLQDQTMPDRALRRKIDRRVAKIRHEHLIIFTDPNETTQKWMWVRREAGKRLACREVSYHNSQSGEALLQKLDKISITLEEEDKISIIDVAGRVRTGFDIEGVTKQFYDRFKKEHKKFLGLIQGISQSADREWYASVMLNRLMFIYFIQRKGFLDGDRDYLQNRLEQTKVEFGHNKFYSFYRQFLLRLFHEGLGSRERNSELEALLGNIPYLNGGLFDIHELEQPDQYGDKIEIPDSAFTYIFDFLSEYEWHLDDRPLRADNEINPDVLGHIFEKYINQKEMGAYYTKEDITDYIGRNTILPYLFDQVLGKQNTAGTATIWDLLRDDPERYIYDSWSHGADIPLPLEKTSKMKTNGKHQSTQIDSSDIELSKLLSSSSPPEELALPTEKWLEVIARRKRYEELCTKLSNGEVSDIDDFVTLNLDIRQFAQDVIVNCEDPKFLWEIWNTIKRVTILDPTCGSGAFLFAALRILEPLYESCLDRMEEFVGEINNPPSAPPIFREKQLDKIHNFQHVLENVDSTEHPNRRFFVLKNIILFNLFGVDIMDEAVEICKLRLFLKLAAEIEPNPSAKNLGIEPLPDIDFNIRTGNALVGYCNIEEEFKEVHDQFDFNNVKKNILAKAANLKLDYEKFRRYQINDDGFVPPKFKQEFLRKTKTLKCVLNSYLASEYDVEDGKEFSHDKWLKSHLPFHWFIEFHGVILDGGFKIVIGNPPYINAKKIRKIYTIRGYETECCSNIYAWIIERSQSLVSQEGRIGMIVPLSLTFSRDFKSLRSFLINKFRSNWFSSFSKRPASLFSANVQINNAIHLGSKKGRKKSYTTLIHRWYSKERSKLFEKIHYAEFTPSLWDGVIPKLSHQRMLSALELAMKNNSSLNKFHGTADSQQCLYFAKTAYNWVSFSFKPAPCFDEDDKPIPPTGTGRVYFVDSLTLDLAHTLLNGKLGFLWWAIVGDNFHVTNSNFANIPFPLERLGFFAKEKIKSIRVELEEEMQANVVFNTNRGVRAGNYNLAKCRNVSDQSDLIWMDALEFQDVWDEVELAYVQLVKKEYDL